MWREAIRGLKAKENLDLTFTLSFWLRTDGVVVSMESRKTNQEATSILQTKDSRYLYQLGYIIGKAKKYIYSQTGI